ncbi:MAG: SPOR domain-containing protein [Muribaculaceae bacterium]|nr:SPOR domain-containing protein [Muribaculaceae bacterium]
MKQILYIIALIILVAGCRTSEANYRSAYEKAIAGRDESAPVDSTIYGVVRRQIRTTMLSTGTDTAQLRVMHISVTPDEGEKQVHPDVNTGYGVVAGQFKTLFNARSLCSRLREAGYPDAFVVQTAEPYYYVIAAWLPEGNAAVAAVKELREKTPVAMRKPLPYLLKAAGR